MIANVSMNSSPQPSSCVCLHLSSSCCVCGLETAYSAYYSDVLPVCFVLAFLTCSSPTRRTTVFRFPRFFLSLSAEAFIVCLLAAPLLFCRCLFPQSSRADVASSVAHAVWKLERMCLQSAPLVSNICTSQTLQLRIYLHASLVTGHSHLAPGTCIPLLPGPWI